jgi:very-short-patch-repair endonuclease
MRLRRGHFGLPGIDPTVARAVRVGGRLACVSELRHRGIWVLDSPRTHVHVDPHATRLRRLHDARVHWGALARPGTDRAHICLLDALVQAVRCLDHRAWIASVDSALHGGQLHPDRLNELRRALPVHRRRLLDLVDRRAESGLESIVRVIAIEFGLRVRSQVVIPGVGRVDLVVEDWIVVETDGAAFHDQALSSRDRLRDARLIASGRSVVRPGYSLVVHDPEAVARELIGAIANHRRVKNSGRLVARARRRAERLGFSGVVDRRRERSGPSAAAQTRSGAPAAARTCGGPSAAGRTLSGRAAEAPRPRSG